MIELGYKNSLKLPVVGGKIPRWQPLRFLLLLLFNPPFLSFSPPIIAILFYFWIISQLVLGAHTYYSTRKSINLKRDRNRREKKNFIQKKKNYY